MRKLLILATTLSSACSGLTCRGQLTEARLAGRVVDADGNGDVTRVTAYEIRVVNGNQILLARCNTTSNKEGKYECPRLPTGRFIIAASTGKRASRTPATTYFSPAATDIGDAEPIVLTAGLDAWAEIHEAPLSGVTLSGKLYPSAPEAAFTFKAVAEGLAIDSGAKVAYDGKTGTFKVDGVLPGHYVLEASWLVEDAEHRAAVPVVVSKRPITGLRVDALANVTLSGTVVSKEANTISRLSMRRVDGMIPELTVPIENGTFLFPTVPSGEYIFSSPDQSVFVDSIVTDGKS